MNRLMDLALGVRLAVGGGRTLKASLLRLVLTTIGIGLATAVLLLVVTAASALSDRGDRLAAREPDTTAAQATPLYLVGGQQVGWDTTVDYVEPAGSGAPVPPGLAAIPSPGQIVVSPALAAKIAADPKTRAIISQQIVGTIGREGLAGPNEPRAYAGATGLRTSRDVETVYGFGEPSGVENLPPQLIMLGTIGVLVLLVPMLVFVASSSRIAGAERERRLSALRLAGAGAAQVRRIAAAEALVGAAFGALLGLLLFLVVRPFAAGVEVSGVEVSGVAVFPDDFVPMWQLVVVVFVLIPVITVGTAWLRLRGLIVEPLARKVMRTVDKNGVHLEQCEGCRGIFLDRGELEQIAGAESAYYDFPALYPGSAHGGVAQPYRGGHGDSPGPYRGHGGSPRPFRGHSDSPRPYRGGYGDSARPYQGGGGYGDSPRPYRGHRKRSFLENLFD